MVGQEHNTLDGSVSGEVEISKSEERKENGTKVSPSPESSTFDWQSRQSLRLVTSSTPPHFKLGLNYSEFKG